jgi:hypothetical protein
LSNLQHVTVAHIFLPQTLSSPGLQGAKLLGHSSAFFERLSLCLNVTWPQAWFLVLFSSVPLLL